MASGAPLQSASSPQPSPPFRTEEREPEVSGWTARTFAVIDTFAWHPGDVPRGIIADIIEDLGVSRDDFYFKKF